jgi:hypothetical protein
MVGAGLGHFGSPLTMSGLPGAWPDSNGAATPGFSDARYRRRAWGRPASKRSAPGPNAGCPHIYAATSASGVGSAV